MLRKTGFAGLANGLSEEENRRLASTPDGVEISALIVKGLQALASSHGAPANARSEPERK